MKKVLFGLAAMAFSGTALSATYSYTLVSLSTGSSNGEASAFLYGNTGYTVDSGTPGTVNQTAGSGGAYFDVSGTALMTYQFSGLSVGGGSASATAYSCIEGSFGGIVGANICGNYVLGSNGIDNSTISYSTVPGTRTMNNNAGTLIADDVSTGAQQQVGDMACTIVSGTAGASDNLVCESALWNSAGVDASGNATGTSTAGMQFTFNSNTVHAVPVPAAAWLFGSALGLLGWVRRRATV